ncbi:hypothetical protein DPMN_017789 [Dreissena polymorpha]|uniref:Uncharacterized protein n=1 Tax=Dreissena polymorpha TaxID=45954 RepID=A0A9D4S7P0_DREPO|nr:hypothetical protein DPMN_017789 [Dreissena polymorpha]
MTTENRTVTLERQMTTRKAWEGHDGLAARIAVPVKEQPQSLPRGGRMRDSQGRIQR